MSDVAGWVVATMIDVALEMGVPRPRIQAMFEGLGCTEERLRRPLGRISWDDYTVLSDRFAALVGGSENVEAIVRVGLARSFGLLNPLAGRLTGVRLLYRIGAEWVGPQIYRCVRGEHRDLPNGRIQQTLWLLPGYRDYPPFFDAQRSAIAAVPSLIGLPNAEVSARVRPKRAVYTITLPHPLKLVPALPNRAAEQVELERLRVMLAPSVLSGRPFGMPRLDSTELDASQGAFSCRVLGEIATQLDGGVPTAASVASALGISQRTLARHLGGLGTTFQELRDEARRRISTECLVRGDSIDDIAIRLGFADSTGFYRAFRRWTGTTPSGFRRGHPTSAHSAVRD